MGPLLCFLVLGFVHNVLTQCMVNDTPTQENFNFEKFMGLWHEIKWYTTEEYDPSTWMSDRVHHAIQTDDNSATFYTRGRRPGSSTCDQGWSTITKPGDDAKLQQTVGSSRSPFWVVDTDYTQYAFVYSCSDISDTGTCTDARAYVWSRSKSLSSNALDRVKTFYQSICVQESAFVNVAFENICDAKKHVSVNPNNTCLVRDLQPQLDFDINKFSGRWYLLNYMLDQPLSDEGPQLWDPYYIYSVQRSSDVIVNVFARLNETEDSCRHSMLNWTKTSEMGEYMEYGVKIAIMATDYRQYALLYKCFHVDEDGTCRAASSHILSRTKELPKSAELQIHRKLQSMCVNPSAFLVAPHQNACKYKTYLEPTSDDQCLMKDLNPQQNFNITKFLGKWYEVKFLMEMAPTPERTVWDMYHFFAVNRNLDVTDNIFVRATPSSECSNQPMKWTKTDTLGVYLAFGAKTFVVATDYNQYALLYKCWVVSEEGRCLQTSSHIVSRTHYLPQGVEEDIERRLRGMCVNPSLYTTARHTDEPCEFKTHLAPTSENQCLVKDLQPQTNFNIERFAGKWYEVQYLVNQPLTHKSALWDMVHHYVIIDSNMDIIDTLHLRTSETLDYCSKIVTRLKGTSTPGVFQESGYNLYVVATDYRHYALLYKCWNMEADGRCRGAASHILSRTPSLPPSVEEEIHTTLASLCVNPSMYLYTHHFSECSSDFNEASSATSIKTSNVMVTLVIAFAIFFKP